MAEIHIYPKRRNHSTLPVDLIHSEILPRLPAASVGRFKCVSKQWHSFLSTQDFLKMHSRHARRRILQIKDTLAAGSTCRTFDCEYSGSKTICPIPFVKSHRRRRPSYAMILASLDGLVCACSEITRELVLWNPLTRAYKKLPTSHRFYDAGNAVGLYIDSCNDYKILHIKYNRYYNSAYIYSRGLDSWRNIKFLGLDSWKNKKILGLDSLRNIKIPKNARRIFMLAWSLATFCGTSLYFTVKEFWPTSGSRESWIVRFDVESEKFSELRFPPLPNGVVSYYGNLMEVENRIHLCVNYSMETNSNLGIWRLMESGDQWMQVATLSEIIPPTVSVSKCRRKWFVMRGWSKGFYVMNVSTENKSMIYIETLVSPNP